MARSKVLIALTLVAGLLGGAATATAGTTPGWPQLGHDAARTRYQPGETTLTPATVGGLQPLATVNGDAAAIGGGRLFALIGTGRNIELKALRADNGDFRWRAPRQAVYVAAGEGKVVTVGPAQDVKGALPQVDVAVYDESCDSACAPLFTERVGDERVWTAPLIYHGWIWFARGDSHFGFAQLVGVPLDCRTDGGVCDVLKVGFPLNFYMPFGSLAHASLSRSRPRRWATTSRSPATASTSPAVPASSPTRRRAPRAARRSGARPCPPAPGPATCSSLATSSTPTASRPKATAPPRSTSRAPTRHARRSGPSPHPARPRPPARTA
jgi:hypothetical protein